ncbi:MAG: ABC transporter ATP-binding protein [Acholeplasmataceae bacterium]|jgi:ATP-binding cassette subfamily B protein|nr:ABC transporter ATP-binding protein [Acholeplasmataceae bacterium]
MRDFEETTRQQSDSKIFKRLLEYAGPYKKNFIVSMIFILFDVALSSVSPMLIGLAVWIVRTNKPVNEKVVYLILVLIVFLISIGVMITMVYFQNILLQSAGQKIVKDLRKEVFEHIERLSLGQFYKVPIGKMVTRVTNDTSTLSEMYTSVIVNLIRNTLMMIVQFTIMLVINVKVTLIMGITLPFVGILTFGYRRLARNQYRRVRNENTNMNAFLQENLSGMKLTQIFNQEERKHDEFDAQNRKLRKEQLKEITLFAFYRPLMYVISMLAGLIVIYYLGSDVVRMIQTGVAEELIIIRVALLVTMYDYSMGFYRPLQSLSEDFNILQSAFASAEKVFDVIDSTPEIEDAPDAVELVDFKGEIEFKNVWFYYLEGEWVLKDISFKINPNDTIAFVGATGSGKTTIMNLIVRNYDVIKGEILVDGINIKKIKLDSLRKHIGQMPQDVFLFTGTIKSNIAFKDDDISTEDIILASKYVGVDSFIESLPDGYDYIVQERGSNFSTGQRQLLSFARALVYEPTVMILDEATANIDSETEEIIQTSLEKMMAISTMIVVAHRLSTIQKADRIYVMQKGEIVEFGSHQELLKKAGIYYSLYELQDK